MNYNKSVLTNVLLFITSSRYLNKMKKFHSYHEVADFLNNVSSEVDFNYNGTNCGAMVGDDGNIVVTAYGKKSTGRKQFLDSIEANNNYISTLSSPQNNQQSSNDVVVIYEDLKECLSHKEPTEEFLKYLQVEEYKKDYIDDKNIGYFDFDKLKSIHPTLNVYGKKHVLFFDTGKQLNIVVKYKPNSRWQNVKGSKATIGAFFKALDNKKPSRILILGEGLKDGKTNHRTFVTADSLANNGKGNSYNFKVHNINLEQYDLIIFANDRDVTADEKITMLESMPKAHHKKVKCLDWTKEPLKSLQGKDITDYVDKILVKEIKTKRDRKRRALSTLRGLLEKENFNKLYIEAKLKKLTEDGLEAIRADNLSKVMRIIREKSRLQGDLINEIAYYMRKRSTPPKGAVIYDFTIEKYIDEILKELIEIILYADILFLNSPTGTGKSTTILKSLLEAFANMIAISPLRVVTDEHNSINPKFYNIRQGKDADTFVDIQSEKYLAMTTDVFDNMAKRYKTDFYSRIKEALVFFDEQHMYYDSQNFRQKVVDTFDHLLVKNPSTTIFATGTPSYPKSFPKDKKVAIINVARKEKNVIRVDTDSFTAEADVVASIPHQQTKGSVLFYCNSIPKVKEIQELLSLNNISTLAITSEETNASDELILECELNGKKIIMDDKLIDGIMQLDMGNIVYIATTKATTGANFANLMTIYQYGTTWTPNTQIQLTGRLRNGGHLFILNSFTTPKESVVQQKAIGFTQDFIRFEVKKLSDIWNKPSFQKYIRKTTLLPFKKESLQDFLNIYRDPLKIIESKGLGKFNIDNNDFEFTGHGITNVDEIFRGVDDIEFRKLIDRIVIDYICQNDIEMLNTYYSSLSFVIEDVTIKKLLPPTKMKLITDERAEDKKAKRKEKREENKELFVEIDEKFKDVDGINAKTLKKNKFSDTEIAKLLRRDIDIEKISSIEDRVDRFIAIKTYIISKQDVFKVGEIRIIERDYLLVKELDKEMQKIYKTNKRTQTPYTSFFIGLFENGFFNDSPIEFNKKKRTKDGIKYNVLTISKEHKKEFEAIKTKRVKKEFMKDKMADYEKKKLLEKLESYEELISTPSRHVHYDMDVVEKEVEKIKGELKNSQK